MKVKEESEKVGLNLNIQKMKIMASGPITSWQIDGETMERVTYCILGGSKITADSDCSHDIKTHLLLGRKDMIMAPHSSTLAWKIPCMEEPGGLQSRGLRRVGHDWGPSLSLFTSMHWRRKWQPTPVFLPENPRDGEAWWAAIYGVAQSDMTEAT